MKSSTWDDRIVAGCRRQRLLRDSSWRIRLEVGKVRVFSVQDMLPCFVRRDASFERISLLRKFIKKLRFMVGKGPLGVETASFAAVVGVVVVERKKCAHVH